MEKNADVLADTFLNQQSFAVTNTFIPRITTEYRSIHGNSLSSDSFRLPAIYDITHNSARIMPNTPLNKYLFLPKYFLFRKGITKDIAKLNAIAPMPTHHTAGLPKELMPCFNPLSRVFEKYQIGLYIIGHSNQCDEYGCVAWCVAHSH